MSGAIAPQVMLEFVGADYSPRDVDMGADEHRAPAYAALCPSQRVPALTLPDGTTIGETAAIILTLGERHAEAGLIPERGNPDRAAFLYWLMFMATIGYPTFSRAWHPEQFTTDDSANEAVRLTGEADLTRFFDMVEGGIAGAPYFMPRGLTALDLYLAVPTEWAADKQALFGRCPKIAALCKATTTRPEYQRVMDRHTAPEVVTPSA